MSYLNSSIKRLQRGTIALNGVTTNTATITSVDTTKTILSLLGVTSDQTDWDRASSIIALTNATTITASKSNATGLATVAYQAVEYYR